MAKGINFLLMPTQKFNVGDDVFEIVLTKSKEIRLYYERPIDRSKMHPLWLDWDDYDDVEYTINEAPDQINIFRFISVLKREIKGFIKRYNLTFFYFFPNTRPKGILYRRIYDQLKDEVPDWTVQVIDDAYFYFKKIE